MINIEAAKELFEQFLGHYNESNVKIKLKHEHTLRVVDFCGAIAESLNLSSSDIELVKLIGLLHDMGRFEQLKLYDTFKDFESIDHAKLGIEILLKNDYLNQYITNPEEKEILIQSILYHNKLRIPDEFNERIKLFCKIIRDADKIDIIKMYFNQTLNIATNAGVINKKVMFSLINHEQVNLSDIVSDIDLYVCEVGFVFDLNYEYTLNYFYQNHLIIDLIDKIMDANQHEQTNLLIIKDVVGSYLKLRLEE